MSCHYIPQPGATRVTGTVVKVIIPLGSETAIGGLVLADAFPGQAGTQWGGPAFQNNPLVFEFDSGGLNFTPYCGQRVTFSVVQGNFVPGETNVQAL